VVTPFRRQVLEYLAGGEVGQQAGGAQDVINATPLWQGEVEGRRRGEAGKVGSKTWAWKERTALLSCLSLDGANRFHQQCQDKQRRSQRHSVLQASGNHLLPSSPSPSPR
jgi:hypothetical protein